MRAAVAVALPALILAACNSTTPLNKGIDPAIASLYAPVDEPPYRVPGVNLHPIDPQYYRQTVAIPAGLPKEPGVIVVDPASRFLYFTEQGGMAIRYGIGVGRDGFLWSGTATIHDKTAWPKWFPPKEMIDREPRYARYADGMDGGIRNPLGARALYIWQGNKDTLYRLHGTNDPSSIGQAVSSGCVRMLNQDVIDLYNRVPLGTKVIVLPAPGALPVVPGTDPVKVGSL
ncbi:MAG TPA: L,D-transpeptidase [Bauldia sp.]|nr:L,D-transpeptidase [Bauldia sp.]